MIHLHETGLIESNDCDSHEADFNMADWATPKFPRNQVDKAGFAIAGKLPAVDLQWAIEVMDNWRSAHSYPLLNFHINLRQKVKNIQHEVIVAQRIKRRESIAAKLVKYDTTQLSQMQDIGGCRAVMASISNVNALVKSYEKSSFKHTLKSIKNYIAEPKTDGYRSYHLVYQYQSLPNQISAYDKLRIEIQIRTKLQHAWATAVEAVGIFTGHALKSNQGDQDWLRLFALMSAEIARIEECAAVPNVPTNRKEFIEELQYLSNKLKAVEKLLYYQTTLSGVKNVTHKMDRYYLIKFDHNQNKITVEGFKRERSQEANAAYTKAESEGDPSKSNIVLVSVDSVNALRKAYPNYFLDTEKFRDLLAGTLVSGRGGYFQKSLF